MSKRDWQKIDEILTHLGIDEDGYAEIVRRYRIEESELIQLLQRHIEEGCCPTCLQDEELGYDDMWPFCCCALMRLLDEYVATKGVSE